MRFPAKYFTRAMLAAAMLPALAGCPAWPRTVDYVDLERYLGLWYEIASYPTFFNQGLVGTTAEYSQLDDGRIRVYNRAYQGNFDGPIEDIEGVARVVDTRTNAKLAVSFSSIPFGRFFEGQYWIIDLDTENYSYAVVTDGFRSTLFVLSRTPTLDPEIFEAILSRLAAQNFDMDRLLLTPQQDATPLDGQ